MGKRQRTRWIFTMPYLNGQLIRAGYVYNNQNVAEDVIRLQIKGQSGSLDLKVRPDEALAISAGLTTVVQQIETGIYSNPKGESK